jgi:hypothetical protein
MGYGSNEFNVQSPTTSPTLSRAGSASARRGAAQGVALQVVFERQTLKPVFHLIGYRLWF